MKWFVPGGLEVVLPPRRIRRTQCPFFVRGLSSFSSLFHLSRAIQEKKEKRNSNRLHRTNLKAKLDKLKTLKLKKTWAKSLGIIN